MYTRSLLFLLSATACMVAPVNAQGNPPTTFSVTRNSVFPPVGLASTETLQINVVNQATTQTGGTAASCTGSITFTSAAGVLIGTATNFTVGSGQVFSASLPFNKAGITGTRGEVVGAVHTTTTFPPKAPCSLSFSLEVFDTSSGATHLFLPGSAASSPAIPLPFGPGR